MKKVLFILAITAISLASCKKDNDVVYKPSKSISGGEKRDVGTMD